MSAVAKQFRSYFQLTKPTIVLLVAVTGFAVMAAEGSFFDSPFHMTLVLFAIILSAGSANAFNQVIDRDIDAIMERTKNKRPLPLSQIKVRDAFLFALVLAVISSIYLWFEATPLAALISIATILFYTFVYTLGLKRRHHYNIVVGGAAGAAAPLIASAAVYGQPTLYAWLLFGIIFMWTPPHFWALALAIKDDYEEVKIPMLPNVLGDRRTRIEIVIYTVLLLPFTLAPYFLELTSSVYLAFAVILWCWYMKETVKRLKEQTKAAYKKLFFVSMIYLFFLFMAVILDGAMRHFGTI